MRGTRVDSVKTVYDGYYRLDEATVAYEKPDGTWSEPSKRLSMERGDAAAVLVHDPERDMLIFVRQYRYPVARHGEPWLLEIVAGGIDAGEEPEAAARREAQEEIGMRLEGVKRVAEFYGSPGGLSERITIFYGRGVLEGDGGGLEGEDVETVELPVAEARAMLDRGEIHDGKTLVALGWFFLRTPM